MSTRVTGKVEAAKQALTVYLPDTRGVTISRWGRGNTKLGMDGVYTYSRLPGRIGGTCPGASPECQDICYAMRVVNTPPVWEVWRRNSEAVRLPGIEDPLPPDAKIVRIHVSGDFDTTYYIDQWYWLVRAHPDVRFFSYTRSWRIPELLARLERLRALPNMQLFASIDKSIEELPPQGWRRAWLEDDPRAQYPGGEGFHDTTSIDGEPGYVCPEETGRKASCQDCNYCIKGKRGDLVFLIH